MATESGPAPVGVVAVSGVRRMVTVFGSLAGAQGVASLMGFAFWALAARSFSVPAVGIAATAVAAMTLVMSLGVMGVSTLIIKGIEATAPESRRSYLCTGLALSLGSTATVALVFAVVAPLVNVSLHGVGGTVLAAAVFVLGASSLSAGSVIDATGMGLGRSRVQVVRALVCAVLRIDLIVVLATSGVRSPEVLILAWVLPATVSVIVVLPQLPLTSSYVKSALALPRRVRGILGESLSHHVLSLSLASASLLVPVVIAAVAPPRQLGWFTSARLISSALLLIPFYLSISLFTTAANHRDELRSQLRHSLRLGVAVTLGVLLVVVVLGHEILSFFGASYARNGYWSLVFLVGLAPFLLVRDQWVTVERIEGRMRSAALLVGLLSALEVIVVAAVGDLAGIADACGAWLAIVALESIPFGYFIFKRGFGRQPGERAVLT
jgi:O-antigen/teichoic acid export membrane protein